MKGNNIFGSPNTLAERLGEPFRAGEKEAVTAGDLDRLDTQPLASGAARPGWSGRTVVGADDVRAGHVGSSLERGNLASQRSALGTKPPKGVVSNFRRAIVKQKAVRHRLVLPKRCFRGEHLGVEHVWLGPELVGRALARAG